jgi:hypothetical protein
MKVCGDFQEQFGAVVAYWNKDLDIDHKINLFFFKKKNRTIDYRANV